MKLIIDIPEEDYKRGTVMASAIRNGIPLPKGHGRLIDADALKETFIEPNIYLKGNEKGFWCVTSKKIKNAPTIVEADKESEEV